MTEPARPDVSVIVPVHNMANYVDQAIRSALDQAGVSVEVIVVDDASTDDSVMRVQALHDKRLQILVLPSNQGVAAARNRALEQARGEWIQFLDPDDRLAPGKLRIQLASAADADVVAGRWREVDEASGRQRRYRPMFDFDGNPFRQILSGNPFPIHALLIRRSLVDAAGGFNGEVYHEDWDFWLKVATCGARFRYAADAEVVYLIRSNSRSSDRRERMRHELAYLDSLPMAGVPATAEDIDAARRARYFQLALLAAMGGDREEAERWRKLCGPLRAAERLEMALVRSPLTAWLAGRLPGPRKLRRLLRGLLPDSAR